MTDGDVIQLDLNAFRCPQCRCFQKTSEAMDGSTVVTVGLCRRNAPVALVPVAAVDARTIGKAPVGFQTSQAIFPVVTGRDWCDEGRIINGKGCE